MSLFGGLSTPSWISPEDADKASWQTSRQFGEIFNAAKDRATQNALNAPMRAAQIAEADASVKATQLGIIQKQGLIDAGVDAKAGEAKLAQVVAQISSEPGGWLKPENEARPWEVATQHPGLLNSAVFQRTINLFGAAGKAEAGRLAAEARATASDERNKTLLDVAAMKTASGEKVAQIGADSRVAVADTKADSNADNQDTRIQIQKLKNQGTLDAVHARIQTQQSAASSTMSKEQLASYKARQHAIWSDLTLPDAVAKQTALDALDKSFGVGVPGSKPVSTPGGNPSDPANLFGPK